MLKGKKKKKSPVIKLQLKGKGRRPADRTGREHRDQSGSGMQGWVGPRGPGTRDVPPQVIWA